MVSLVLDLPFPMPFILHNLPIRHSLFLQKSFVVFNKPINLNDQKPIDQQIYPAPLRFSLA